MLHVSYKAGVIPCVSWCHFQHVLALTAPLQEPFAITSISSSLKSWEVQGEGENYEVQLDLQCGWEGAFITELLRTCSAAG